MSGFTIPLDKFLKGGIDKLDIAVRKIVMEVYKGVIMDTPVKTGRARGNWQPAIGSAPTPMAAGEDGFLGEMAQSFELDPSGRVTVAAMTDTAKDWYASTGVPFILANNLPYIQALNDGHSQQAPKHFVELNVIRAGGIASDVAGGTL